MKPIRSIKNQYHGINPHLHSYWQNLGGWSSFHGNHMADLLRALRVILLPMGYTAEIEPSLQIRRLDQFMGVSSLSEKEFAAIGVYKVEPDYKERGQPVVWIELLSPSNKEKGDDATFYLSKRNKSIQSGIVFVEIDYLHESTSTLSGLASYRIHRFMVGRAYITEFNVDDPIPTVEIPLNREDLLRFDFDKPYQKSYEETLYGLEIVDYSQLPIHFDRYSIDDQTRIARRMLAVIQAAHSHLSLEGAPLPVETLSLQDALKQIQAAVS